MNAIDYQEIDFKVAVNTSTAQKFEIPMPINSKLISVTARMDSDPSSVSDNISARLTLESNESNVRVFQMLDNGILSEHGQGSVSYDISTIGGIYNFPIQKSGINLVLSVYNATTTTHRIRVNWVVENMEQSKEFTKLTKEKEEPKADNKPIWRRLF